MPLLAILIGGIISSACVGVSPQKEFLEQVFLIALDPRTVGTQMDDSIMQKNLTARILAREGKYLFCN